MRKVHEMARSRDGRVVVAFIQHGVREEGFRYENVCPWCSRTVGEVEGPFEHQGAVLTALQAGMAGHLETCDRRGSYRLEVEKTTVPLGTDRPVIVM